MSPNLEYFSSNFVVFYFLVMGTNDANNFDHNLQDKQQNFGRVYLDRSGEVLDQAVRFNLFDWIVGLGPRRRTGTGPCFPCLLESF